MAYHVSTSAELTRVRSRGQRPDGPIVVGDMAAGAWAARNRFFFVDARDLGDDLDALAGLDVLVRTSEPNRLSELVQRIVLTARYVTVFDTRAKRSEFLHA